MGQAVRLDSGQVEPGAVPILDERSGAGLPEDVAALVDRLSDKETGITLVNISPLSSRTVIIQGGAYGEHRFVDVTTNGERTPINGSTLTVELAPSSGAHLVLSTKRYVNAPTMSFPWKRDTLAAKSVNARPLAEQGSREPVGIDPPAAAD